MNIFTKLITPILLISSISIANAASLSLTPSSQFAGTGDTVSVNLEISGLGNNSASSLGDFDMDIFFDSSKLSFTSGLLGNELGDPDPLFFETDFANLSESSGIINVALLSLLDSADLISNQSDTFVLATFNFLVDNLSVGDSTIVDFDQIRSLGDEKGIALNIASTSNAIIRNPNNNVPEPTTWLLLLPGLIFTLRKRNIA